MGEEKRDDVDEQSLIALCQSRRAGALEAFSTLVRRYETRVFRSCRRLLGNDADAEDASQEVFITMFRKIDTFEGRSRFGTWLFTITRNVCLTALDARRKLGEREQAYDDDSMQTPGESDGPEQSMEHAQLLDRTFARLGEEDRAVLVARFVAGLKLDEIAETENLSLSAAKMRLYRAMQRFVAIAEELSNPSGASPGRES